MSDSAFRVYLILFTALVAFSYAAITWVVVSNDHKIRALANGLNLSRTITDNTQDFLTDVNAAITFQRLYVVGKYPPHLEEYRANAAAIPKGFDELLKLVQTQDDQSEQLTLLRMIERDTVKMLEIIESRLALFEQEGFSDNITKISLSINALAKNINAIGEKLLRLESANSSLAIADLQQIKSQYALSLILGIGISSIVMLLMISAILKAQNKSARAEINLKKAEERLRLAVEGTADGVFDWEIKTGTVYYSEQFKNILGYTQTDTFPTTTHELRKLIHADDLKQVERVLEAYLAGSLAEYSNVFRMQHKRGHWVWINASGKAIHNNEGEPVRLVGVHTDITLIKESEAKLVEAMQRAEEANRAKSDFLAHMSHEIRTPLTAISGIAEIMGRQLDTLSDKQQKLITTLNASASSLKDLINDILDFSKIESGEIDIENREIDVEELFEQVISIMNGSARQKGLEFDFDYLGLRDRYFHGDAQRLRQVLINLIGNAIKFTDVGKVSIVAKSENQQLHISVIDTGIGISADKLGIIFERFKQADSSVSRRYGGTGLGLPISRRLVELMGGNLAVHSEAGAGSTFTITLPDLQTSQHSSSATHNKRNPHTSQLEGGEGKVLVAEDYEGNVVVLSYLLDDLGYHYDIVSSGLEAVNMWRNNSYDLILMDVQMPDMDGFTATSIIREAERTEGLRRTPIIGMTAHALIGDKEKCIAAGMDSYMPKPIDEQEFMKKVNQFMPLKHLAS